MFSIDYLNAIRAAETDRIASFLRPGAQILEIGAGTGLQALELSRRGFQVAAIEVASSNYADHRVFPIVDYDGAHVPFPDGSFDIVFSSNVLEHVPDLCAMHAEIRRVLRSDGYCVHVLPTHTWRIWTTLSGYPDTVVTLIASAPQLVPRSMALRSEIRRLADAWYRTARRVAGLCRPLRHGERGNVISETWLFHPSWWRRNFRANGFEVVQDEPMGLFYTGNLLFGPRLPLDRRAKLARGLGSACHIFKLVRARQPNAPPGPRSGEL